MERLRICQSYYKYQKYSNTSVSCGAGTRIVGGPGEVCEGEDGVREADPGLSCRLGIRTCKN